MKITIIGAGVMGKIFLAGVIRVYPLAQVSIADRDLANLKKIKKVYKRVNIGVDAVSIIKGADLVIIAVKPQSFVELAQAIKGQLKESTMVLSIMAGVSMAKIKKLLAAKKVVRSMPNLGARVGKSMTVWTATKSINASQKKFFQKLFSVIGVDLYVHDEIMIDKATAVSGSGPGFFFNLVDKWIKATTKLGFSRDQSQKLIFATIDAANTLMRPNNNLEELTKQVASKGGTTEAGLRVMDKGDMMKWWLRVLNSAYQRARQLSK